MRQTYLRFFLVLNALLAIFAGAPAQAEVRDPGVHFFQPNLGDLPGDVAAARSEGKLGFLFMFEMEDCPFCSRMKGTVLNQSEVQDYFRKHFVIYAMDVKGSSPLIDFQGNETTEKGFALAQRARATPTFIFYDLEGKPLAKHIGPTQTPEDFLLLGRYVVDGHYRSQPFNVFKAQQQGKK